MLADARARCSHRTRPTTRRGTVAVLARNGVVAALGRCRRRHRGPARSGALNTAAWAAGRIPVLAVPGDVDRPHVAGCLALIRDGATLARDAGDVLEAIGRSLPLPLEATPRPASATPHAVALLAALDAGAHQLDELVSATGIEAAAVLAAATVLELEGSIRGAPGGAYVRVVRAQESAGAEPFLNLSC